MIGLELSFKNSGIFAHWLSTNGRDWSSKGAQRHIHCWKTGELVSIALSSPWWNTNNKRFVDRCWRKVNAETGLWQQVVELTSMVTSVLDQWLNKLGWLMSVTKRKKLPFLMLISHRLDWISGQGQGSKRHQIGSRTQRIIFLSLICHRLWWALPGSRTDILPELQPFLQFVYLRNRRERHFLLRNAFIRE